MTQCDGIKDLSLYMDSNPNHLPYECPLCVGKMECLPRIFYKKKESHLFEAFVNKQLSLKQEAKLYEEKLALSRKKLVIKEKELIGEQIDVNLEKEIMPFREQLAIKWNNIIDRYQKDYEDQVDHLRRERNSFELKVEKHIIARYEEFINMKVRHKSPSILLAKNKES